MVFSRDARIRTLRDSLRARLDSPPELAPEVTFTVLSSAWKRFKTRSWSASSAAAAKANTSARAAQRRLRPTLEPRRVAPVQVHVRRA